MPLLLVRYYWSVPLVYTDAMSEAGSKSNQGDGTGHEKKVIRVSSVRSRMRPFDSPDELGSVPRLRSSSIVEV